MSNVIDIRRKLKKMDQSVVLTHIIIQQMIKDINMLPTEEARREYVCILLIQMLKWMDKSNWFPDVIQAVKNAYSHVEKEKKCTQKTPSKQ